MSRYRKLPVEIEAMQLVGATPECFAVYQWVEPMCDSTHPYAPGACGVSIDPADGQMMIRTLEGDMKVSVGDYVIRGVRGEFYPCKPDIFAATYEPVVEQ